ncbi:MAG: diadenylate cyclase [Synechococcaceae cyanobacterium]|nr:diadenylate cyclase [Synechococcaceae cyanobacterium]
MILLQHIDYRLLFDLLFASMLGLLLLGRVSERRTLWLLRGYLLLVALAWFTQRYVELPLTTKLVDALVLACSLALAIIWQAELRRLMEQLGTGNFTKLFADRRRGRLEAGSVSVLTDAAGRLSQARRGALIVLDLGGDLSPEDFMNPGVPIDAKLTVELLLSLFSVDTPLHDGAVLVTDNRITAAGVILPLLRQPGIPPYGTRHLAALSFTERHGRCRCIVVSEETGTLSLASQGRLERPITSSRLHDLLSVSLAPESTAQGGRSVAADPPEPRG